MPWRVVALGAVVGVASVKLLLSRGDGPQPDGGYSAASVTFRAGAQRKTILSSAASQGAGLLPASAAIVVHQPRKRRRWVLEGQLLALQLVLAAVATVTADRLHGRQLAENVLVASLLLICVLLVLSLLSAAVSAARQERRQRQPWQWSEQQAAKAAAIGEALLAEMGGPKQAAAEAAPPRPRDFSGVWDKDKEASDSMEPAMDVMQLNPLVRRGVGLVRGLIVKQDEDAFEMAVFSALPWFKVVERYPFSGEERQFKRRDLRRGKHVGRAEVLPDGRLRLHVAWGNPLGGTGTDTFSIPREGMLHVDTVLVLTDQTPLEYRTVYRRRS